MRFFMRVDQVLVRVSDTRIYHEVRLCLCVCVCVCVCVQAGTSIHVCEWRGGGVGGGGVLCVWVGRHWHRCVKGRGGVLLTYL